MQCPYCGHDSKVVDSRPIPDGIRRRRECTTCGRRFTTHERLAPVEIRVVKTGGRPAEAFDREKIARVVERVAASGPLGRADAQAVALRIETDLVDARRSSVESWEIARSVHDRLAELDRATAARFAADYADADGNPVFAPPTPPGEPERRARQEQFGLFEG
jgi:transcriptional repressor NrdR